MTIDPNDYVRPGEAKAILNVSRQRISQLVSERRLESITLFGGLVLISRASVVAWLERRAEMQRTDMFTR